MSSVMTLKRYPSASGMTFGKIGARRMMKSWTARDYVQDGLVAMWDGIENAGWGVHDASTNTWKDLSGHDYDFTLNSNAVFTDSYIERVSGSTGPIGQLSTAIDLSSPYTLEIVFTTLSQKSRQGVVAFSSNGLKGVAFSNANLQFDYFQQIYSGKSDTFSFNAELKSYSAYVDTQGTISLFRNNIEVSSKYRNYTNYYLAPILMGSRYYESDSRISQMRIYNGEITASTRAHNYAVDKLRFNLP